MKTYCVIDYETRSQAHLRTRGKTKIGCGAWEYAVDPTTEILCVAWRIGTRESLKTEKTKVWLPKWDSENKAHSFFQAVSHPDVLLVAHNAGFEQVITRHVLPRHTDYDLPKILPVERWACTAALAAAHALPRNLEGACSVLNLPVQKDPMGKLLIQRHCMPHKPTKKNPSLWNDDLEGLDRLAQYCMTDVDAETELFLALPPLISSERRVWQLNQRLNLRGVYVDRPLVEKALVLIQEESQDLNRRAMELTEGIAPTRRDQILKILGSWGCYLPNLQAKTVSDAILSGFAQGNARELLEIRQMISKTSTAKYQAFDVRSRSDGRLRDLQMYHGASTGRDAGTGVQPHNFPRGTLRDVESAIETICEGDRVWLRALHGNVMAALSSCLRGCIQATPGFELFCADFNAIEARVLFWVAQHDAGLQMFQAGVDLYRAMAARIFSKDLKDVTDAERELGKRAILGCGFQMGHPRFRETCQQFGMPITEALAEHAVTTYRSTHAPVPRLWENLNRAALLATRYPGKTYAINRTRWFVSGRFLHCELPSKRRLSYFGPTVRQEEKWGRVRPVLYHWGENGVTKQWENSATYGGKLTENVVQAVARDLMVSAQVRTEDAGYIPLISVHDELLAERKLGQGTLGDFESLMAQVPEWGAGMPVKVKGWKGPRYKK